MMIELLLDEVLSSGPAKAGARITVTASNADECDALRLMGRAILIDDTSPSGAVGQLGPSIADQHARGGAIALSAASFASLLPAGTVLARIITDLSGLVTLIDDAGGRVTVSGRSLVATSIPFAVGGAYKVTLQIGSTQQSFDVAGAGRAVVHQGQQVTFNGQRVTYGAAA